MSTSSVAPSALPALSLIAMPGRRARTVDLAVEIERRGFPSVWCPSYGDPMALCHAILGATTTLVAATSIQPIYLRHAVDLAQHAAFLHEVSGGRFLLGIGVSHGPALERLGVDSGKPLSDMRAYVSSMRAATAGPLPPIVLATLRSKMVDLALEIADGAVFANGSCSTIATAVSAVSSERRSAGFTLGDMVPTVITDDLDAAKANVRKTLAGYVRLPNYRNYWRGCGYEEEMAAIEAALSGGRAADVGSLMSDRWLHDVTLIGSATVVRGGVERWIASGVTPILVPSAVSGGQFQAFDDVFAAFS